MKFLIGEVFSLSPKTSIYSSSDCFYCYKRSVCLDLIGKDGLESKAALSLSKVFKLVVLGRDF